MKDRELIGLPGCNIFISACNCSEAVQTMANKKGGRGRMEELRGRRNKEAGGTERQEEQGGRRNREAEEGRWWWKKGTGEGRKGREKEEK
ncbi:hypothetical protein PoB_001242500 [Plakobranchus ocellatus]|uniref:Uncharacterized protein n=1 Tax=Plakobranchus ocellatus TaxID=259542 RepID=A0AAV3YT05_9GAST|nr:hypothetical protein PoB_001242500 [Plakobranchus ocellatus]